MPKDTIAARETCWYAHYEYRAHYGTESQAMTNISLDPALHRELSDFFGTELPPLHLHTGPGCRRTLRTHGAAALTVDGRIILAPETYSPGSFAGRALLAHETAHVLQQTVAGPLPPGAAPDPLAKTDPWEHAAQQAGLDFALGRHPRPGAQWRHGGAPPRVQAYGSYEHWLLGDAPQDDLVAMVLGQGTQTARDAALTAACNLLYVFANNPTQANPTTIKQHTNWPIRTMYLQGSELWVTYGELNTLADYFAIYAPNSPESFDQLPQSVVLPIVQMVREMGWNALNKMMSNPQPGWLDFSQSAFHGEWVPASFQSLTEAQALDSLTSGLGPSGRDHVEGLLARNACHFAPFSWFRWKAFFEQAVSLATQAHASGGNQQLVAQTWLMLGYANHFLQDSFAAGHLINKSLVMQWFVEWAATQSSLAVYDWDSVKNMTTSAQPLLAGLQLYQPGAAGPSNDPQTAEEQPDAATSPYDINRVNATGIQAANGLSQQDAYQAYLSWLDSPVCQVVTAQLHDYLNGRGVQAQGYAGPRFLTYGDNTMLEGTTNAGGGTGPGLARAAALLTETAIASILANGGTTTTVADVMALFPTQVVDNTGTLVTLEQWHAAPSGELYNLAISNESFDSWKTWGTGLGSYAVDLGVISVDQPSAAAFRPSWSQNPTAVGFHTNVRAATCSWPVNGSAWQFYFYVPSGTSTIASYRRDSGNAVEVPVPASVSTTMAPAVAVSDNQLYLAYTSPDGEVNLWSTADGENWTGPTAVPGLLATSGPGLCSFAGGLLLAAQVAGGVAFSRYQNGTWSPSPQDIPGAVPGGTPALASLGSTALIVYNEAGGHLYISTYNGSTWQGLTQQLPDTTKMDVAVAAVNSTAPSFVLMYTGTNSNLYWRSSADGSSWSGGNKLSLQASGPPALGVNDIS
ncbi:MAG TPA: DUF4157 domain-containing protein, partial [Acidimicrobiales bacterium]|nr:DUF4157 domain-containing protein [Acidimicrobiales bacterium]